MSFYSNITPVHNGNLQVKSTTRAHAMELVGQQGFQDFSTITQMYEEDPLRTHKTFQQWFGQQSESSVPSFFQDILQNDAVLEINGWESTFTYDVPIETDTRLKTTDDYSYQVAAGADGTTFKICLNREFAPNTKLTCDALDGDEILVSEAEPVRNLGHGFEHTVILNTADPDKIYPSYLLEADIEYFEIGGGVAEYGEKLNLLHMPEGTNYNTYEFELGSPQGVETWFTGKADSIDLSWGTAASKEYFNEVESYYRKGNEVVMMQQRTANGSRRSIGTMLEMLAIEKFNNNMSKTLMFGKGGKVKTEKGVVTYNEGLWPQMRRGYILTYGKRGGITRELLKQARDYVFRNNPMKNTIDSEITFEAGSEAFKNVLGIYQDEISRQINNLGFLLGADRILPSNPVSGDLYNLVLKPVRFTSVWLPDIGQVKINENMTLNQTHMVDRNLSGMNPNGYDWTTYSMVIWDAMDQTYSNNREFPRGVTPIAQNNEANIWMVTPKGDKIYWGRENGRYSVDRAKDIVSSNKLMMSNFWIYGFGAIWMRDSARFVMIELEKSARKGYR